MTVLPAPDTTYVRCLHCDGTHKRLSECPTLQRLMADIKADPQPRRARHALVIATVAIGLLVFAVTLMTGAGR